MQKILYTGARSGIAASVIETLINKDFYIYISVHTEQQLKEVKQVYQNIKNVECLKIDINDLKDQEIIKKLDIDILVANAAIGIGGSIIDIDIDKIKENYETNVFSNFKIIQAVLNTMLKKDSGRIIIMSSLAGIIPIKFLGSYCSTKASIIKLTQCLKKELKMITKNIKISLILPGMYHTGFNQVMLENKYPEMDKSIFKDKIKEIRFKEDLFWNSLEKNNLNSISNKVYKAITSNYPKFIYSAPLLQTIGAKIYQLFMW